MYVCACVCVCVCAVSVVPIHSCSYPFMCFVRLTYAHLGGPIHASFLLSLHRITHRPFLFPSRARAQTVTSQSVSFTASQAVILYQARRAAYLKRQEGTPVKLVVGADVEVRRLLGSRFQFHRSRDVSVGFLWRRENHGSTDLLCHSNVLISRATFSVDKLIRAST